jgi:integrase
MSAIQLPVVRQDAPAGNKGRIIGQKRPLLPKHVWAIRVRLEIANNIRDLARFNMAIDCKLRGCDLVRLKVRDVFVAGHRKERASVLQSKTQRPVQFEIIEQTRKAVQRWIESPAMFGCDDLWPSRFHGSPHLSIAPVCPHPAGLGDINRSGAKCLRHTFDAANQSGANLQEDRELVGRATSSRPYQNGQHGAVPRDRA